MDLYFADHNVASDEEIDHESNNFNFINEILNELNEEFLNPKKPVSKRALRALPVIIAKKEHTKMEPCAICQASYELEEQLVMLPCKHYFHKECVFEWFQTENTCCLCRSELESDNPEHESSKIDKKDQKNDIVHSMYI